MPGEDDDREKEWLAQQAKTDENGIPIAIEPKTPRPEVTGDHRMTPAMFASGVELAERDGFERGKRIGRAEAQADNVVELRKVREDCIDTVRALFTIFEIRYPEWAAAEEWIRRRLTPL